MWTLGKHREMRTERKTESADIILKVMNELSMLGLLGNTDQKELLIRLNVSYYFVAVNFYSSLIFCQCLIVRLID